MATTLRSSFHKSEYTFYLLSSIAVALFCILSLVYLSHTNSVATKGYEIKQLREEKKVLQAELSKWNLKLVQTQSLQNLSASSTIQGMKTMKNRIFLQDPSLAYNQ
ncbi:hypothetical protein COB57_02290 [Candidatus Peregrinibacteria bacterium]|nr:MAG: hypothetical protein COB57_02290 [Candidatus Peregrinibacteria bacterium]